MKDIRFTKLPEVPKWWTDDKNQDYKIVGTNNDLNYKAWGKKNQLEKDNGKINKMTKLDNKKSKINFKDLLNIKINKDKRGGILK